ncbi:MAG: phospho-N-acetylmuramoyl-pentapeptide-transferase [Planctomycetota bacterium]|jgi:phospho-N-acetylmuramoyl-pentapeptide-transferase
MIFNLINASKDWLIEAELWRFLQVFNQITFRAVAAIVLSFLIVTLFGKRTIQWLVKQKIGDNPEFNHKDLNSIMRHKTSTPTMGGILISAAIFVSVLLLADLTNFYIRMALLAVTIYAALGVVDDWLKLTSQRRSPGSRDGLHSWEKLLFQVGWALLLGFFIHNHGQLLHQQLIATGRLDPDLPNMTHILNLPFQRTWLPAPLGEDPLVNPDLIQLGSWGFGILAVCVIAGSSNAVNLTDGMDGLASGIMGIVSFAFMILCLVGGTEDWAKYLLVPHVPTANELAVLAGAMCGACLGFLWYNCNPAMVFMGDTGSLPLGGLIGYIAVVIRQELLLVVIGGVLVFEALSVIIQVGYFKISGGSRVFKCAPVHHHFHLSGWTEQQVVVRFWLITAMLVAFALATVKLREYRPIRMSP